ncbi:LysR substrate-binding domain-containing protein [Pseudomonas sp. RIT-To-2]|uniref:LysR substrate-binding domain-containing protein n=1 Tax=Pseudomonas sp. RIT-To-2 TaxID=3462541 RepID=UPI002412F7A5
MKLHQLRALLAIAESGSIHEAAKVVHISQPALSKSIKDLEEDLGVPLLVRSNRGITVTAYGERLVDRARLIVGETRKAREEISFLKDALGGRVSIGVAPVTPTQEFVRCIQQYRRRHPTVNLQITELRPAQLMTGMRQGTLDIALTSQPPNRALEGFDWHHLYHQEMTVAVRDGHPKASARRLSELLDEEWILPDPIDASVASDMFRKSELNVPARIIECSSLLLYAELAMSLDAVSLWSHRAFNLSVIRKNMVPLQLDDHIPTTDISVVSRPSSLMSPPVRSLVEDLIWAYRSKGA